MQKITIEIPEGQVLKMELIQLIAAMEDEVVLAKVQEMLQELGMDTLPYNPKPEWELMAEEPLPEYLHVEELAQQQGYNIADIQNTLHSLDKNNWSDEKLEELIRLLK